MQGQKWEYQDDEVLVTPFVNTAQFQFPENFLVDLYYQAKESGALGLVFGNLGLADVIASLKDKPLVVGVTKPDYNVSGVGWLHQVETCGDARKASVGFLFLNGSDRRKKRATRAIARLALKWWYCGLKVDVLYGTILEDNKAAQNFGRRIGFTKLCTLPKFLPQNGRLADAALLVQTKEDFFTSEVALGRRPIE